VALHVDPFVRAVAVDVAAEVDVRAVELLERLGHPHGKSHDLVRSQLLFQRGARFGPVVDDASRVPPIKTVGRAVVPWIGIVKDRDDQAALEGLGTGDRGHVGEILILDGLQGTFGDLAAILPAGSDCVRKKLGGVRD